MDLSKSQSDQIDLSFHAHRIAWDKLQPLDTVRIIEGKA